MLVNKNIPMYGVIIYLSPYIIHHNEHQLLYLAKLLYSTNLGFPEIAGDFPYFSPPFGVKTRVFGRYNLTRLYAMDPS